ncbi:TPA: hypothetical protein ACGRV9_006506 [Pseudomonas aeruginosa]
MTNELTDVRCPCGDEFPADSYDAGFIAGSGMCQNCDAAMPPKDIPAPVEQAGGDERDFQAKGAQEVPSPVSKEYDRHLISLLRKGEALPGHQEEAADEIERLRDWNDHLNNTVLPNILNPNFLMLMKGGERLLDLCTKDGEFIGVSLNDMKDLFDWMVTHARIAPDQAALAQPSGEVVVTKNESGAIVSVTRQDKEGRVLSVIAESATLTAQAEKAEVERPEVVARVVHSNPVVLGQCGPLNANDELMTVAQHAASVARWAEMFNRVEQQRDAALARVASLESKLAELEKQDLVDVPGPDEIHQIAFEEGQPADDGDGYLFSAEEFDLFVQRLLDSCAAPVAQAQQLHDLDKQCRDDVARALGLRPSQERGFAWSYLLASIKSCVKASEDAAQAQHSVPEGVTIERDVAGTIHIKVGDFDFIQLQYQRPYTDNASTWKLAERIASLLAAAPGTEVPQAWLDVQAERRRQITAEGWTPDHDDLYCAAELPRAAAAYILSGANDEAPAIWPFSAKWWKPRDARANYMRAGALILAEIERLDRAAERGKEVGHE